MAETKLQDAGLVQRGLLLLGGMTALVVVVLLIVLRSPESPRAKAAQPLPLMVPMPVALAPFPAAPAWPILGGLSEQMPSTPGWEIRYNAAAALARRGSAKTPWPLIREMLDQRQQLRNFTALKSGRIVPHEEDAQHTVFTALVAVADWHRKQKSEPGLTLTAELQDVYDQVDRIAKDGNTFLRVQADRTRQAFLRKSQ